MSTEQETAMYDQPDDDDMSEQIEEYTPTTDDMMRYFVAPPYKTEPQREGEEFASYLSRISIETMHSQMASERAARRWLRAHDAEITEQLAAAQAVIADELVWWEEMREDHAKHLMILRTASIGRLTAALGGEQP